jgi:GNAT superfamily N-acetyltransferase
VSDLSLRLATPDDVPVILDFIRALARYEKLEHQVTADEARLRESLFGPRPAAEALLGYSGAEPVAFAVFFHNFSTFLGRRGLYLEDVFVKPECRGQGHGRTILRYLARLAVERGCGRFEWTVLDWNTPAIEFYRAQGADVLPDWRVCRVTGDALIRMSGTTAG